jgi:2',3'-cyclic-nucleotide 2'-phosphodiesterase (5'-nucleotidase family)
MKNKFFAWMIIGLFIFMIGCSDDDSTPYDPKGQVDKTYIYGMAADGDPIQGAVIIKGMKKLPPDSTETPVIEETVALINPKDGTFKGNVTNLDPPYLLQTSGKGTVDDSVNYYAIASSENEWTNCTKYSDAAVRMATNNSPETQFVTSITIPDDYEQSKNQITKLVQDILSELPNKPDNASAFNPFTTKFVADESDGFDNLLGMTKIAVDSDSLTIASNKNINSEIIYVANYKTYNDRLDPDPGYNLSTYNFDVLKNELIECDIKELTILQTSDLHNHASGYGPLLDYTPMDTSDNDTVKGGFARLASVIAANKVDLGAKGIPVLLVDSGDYFMGTMYDMAATAPVPFVYFKALSYDAITFGNHEFDWAPSGLAMLLNNAISHSDMPFTFNVPIVASNTNIPITNELFSFKTTAAIDDTHSLINDKLIKKLPNGLTVGILGWMGETADAYAPAATPVTFTHSTDELLNKMDSLIEEDQCNLILILSHGGVDENGTGDDTELAEAIGKHTKIDYNKRVIIASGHAHTATRQPFIRGADKTFIFSPGAYGQYLSRFNIRFDMNKEQIVDYSFNLIEINDRIPGYKDIDDAVKQVNAGISEKMNESLGTSVDAPVAILKDYEITFSETKAGPSGLGKLCTDATRAVANALALSSTNNTPYMLSIMANGNIRDTLKPGKTGKITFSDIFNVLPLGLSPKAATVQDIPPGYPLFSVYLNAADIRKLCELSVAVELQSHPLLTPSYYLHFSGIQYEYNATSQLGTRVNNVSFFNPADPMCTEDIIQTLPAEPVQNSIWDSKSKVVYRAVVDLYLLQMFYTLRVDPAYNAFSSLLPVFKDKNGDPLPLSKSVDASQYISFSDAYAIDTGIKDGAQELYAWTALLKYMQAWKGNPNFVHEDGLPVIPIICPYNSNYFQRTWKHDSIAKLTILQTSDIHNHASGYGPFLDYTPMDTTDNDGVTGGMARLAGKIAELKIDRLISNVPMLLVDSGDYFMGTMYDMAASAPVPFFYFEALGYDAITLGNHEFDWGPAGLAMLINKGINNELMPFHVPIVATNTIIPTGNVLIPFQQNDVIKDNIIKTLPNGLKVAILGWMGKQADAYAPGAGDVDFNHTLSALQDKIDELKSVGCDLILMLSHGGVEESGEGDDKDLANAVNGLDIIASGHAHTATHDVFEVNGALIFSPGSFGQYLSRLDIEYNLETKAIENHEFTLIPIDDSIQGYAEIHNAIEQVNAGITEKISESLGLNVSTPVALLKNFEITYVESDAGQSGLGNLCTDAARAVANQLAQSFSQAPYMLSFIANGTLRDSIKPGKTGKITFSDIFNVLPLGLSLKAATNPNTPPGYPLYSVYLNAADIRKLCELSVAVKLKSDPLLTPEYYLHFSGIKYAYNSEADLGQRVNQVSFYNPADPMCISPTIQTLSSNPLEDNSIWDSESKVLYRAVVDLYLLQMFYTLGDDDAYAAFRPLLPTFRDANGDKLPIEQSIDSSKYEGFSNAYAIDTGPEEGAQELYAWTALLKYIQAWSDGAFPLEDGLPVLPEKVPYNNSYVSSCSRVIAQ